MFGIAGILFVFVLIFSGCATASSADRGVPFSRKVLQTALTEVRKYDGIDRAEAITLAQSEMIYRGRDEAYRLDQPQIEEIGKELWVVRFHPVVHTLQERNKFPISQITIDRQDGQVRFKDVWQEL